VIAEIDSEALQRRLAGGEQLEIVDIRSPGEVAQGIIPGSWPLPMHLIPLRLSDLPKDRELVLYCRSGARSYHACTYLMQQGYRRVVNLRGGIVAWGHGTVLRLRRRTGKASRAAVHEADSLPFP
jgi:rhodanese-related sulfurtransferase